MNDYSLLSKTELRIDHVYLNNANLTRIASTVAEVLMLDPSEVLVVDYRDNSLVLDILNHRVDAYNIVGKKALLMEKVGALPGVSVTHGTDVVSGGMLGWIGLDADQATGALRRGEKMAVEISGNISKRALVFSSGKEVADREIEDTNTPAIMDHMKRSGYKPFQGGVLNDDRRHIAARLREAAETGGYGVIITTGGVGAEGKDCTVEAITELDADAATPYICHFQAGTGRHVKDGVKIAVGSHSGTLIIALPGPNDEVKASLGPLTEGLKNGLGKKDLAEMIAANLRRILRGKMAHAKGGPHENRQIPIPDR